MAYIMQPPEELMTQSFLPAMRQLVAIRLRSEGLSQNRISSLLGVTQASVSLYLSSEQKKAYSALAGFAISQMEADGHASRLASAVRKNALAGVVELNAIWTDTLGSGSACPAHRNLYPSLSECDMCIKEYGRRKGARSQAVADVEEGVRLIEGSSRFAAVMPEVSVNLARAAGDAASPADVVAIPGRIVKVKDRAKAMLPPEAGASAHMARILLLARSHRPELGACINLRYDRKMAAVMRKSGLRALSIGRYSLLRSHDPTADALERRLKSATGPMDAVIDEGGSGIEPNVYLFARSAREVAGLALRLARAYSAA
jgi:predicted fused transcriptional regulator/phosphomethylpyrimidine kinase/predicted transcriptional regulator